MEMIILFFLELFVLFLFSRSLQKNLSLFLFLLTKSMKWTVSILAFIFLPGTFIHEIAHLLMAHLMFVPVGKLELIPKLEGESVKLGSVAIARSDPFRRLLIGIAPFLIGTIIIISTLLLAEKQLLWHNNYVIAVIFYILFEIGNSMFSSKKDLEGAMAVVLLAIIVVIISYFLGVHIQLQDIQNSLNPTIIQLFYQGVIYLLFPLGLDLGLIAILSFLNKLLSRR